jgi:hypothetical protein
MSRHTEWQKNLDAFDSLSSAEAEVLREVYEREENKCRDELVLVFTRKILVIQANAEDDTISVRAKSIATFKRDDSLRKSASGIWQPLIGRAFGWGWITVNQQGYCDGALLGFDGISPSISLEVVASSIEINGIVPQADLQPFGVEISENGEIRVREVPVRAGLYRPVGVPVDLS